MPRETPPEESLHFGMEVSGCGKVGEPLAVLCNLHSGFVNRPLGSSQLHDMEHGLSVQSRSLRQFEIV